jgi:hypothetical protein
MHTRDLAMTPEGDEIYFSVSAGPVVAILGSRLVGGEWTQPEVADFSADPTAGEIEPQISPDGSRFFFMSTRQPYPGEAPDRLTRNWLLNFHSGPESGNPAMYWMNAGFVEDLRQEAVWGSSAL